MTASIGSNLPAYQIPLQNYLSSRSALESVTQPPAQSSLLPLGGAAQGSLPGIVFQLLQFVLSVLQDGLNPCKTGGEPRPDELLLNEPLPAKEKSGSGGGLFEKIAGVFSSSGGWWSAIADIAGKWLGK